MAQLTAQIGSMKASVETTRDEVGECLEAVKCDLNTKVSQAKADTYSHSLTIASLERGQQRLRDSNLERRKELWKTESKLRDERWKSERELRQELRDAKSELRNEHRDSILEVRKELWKTESELRDMVIVCLFFILLCMLFILLGGEELRLLKQTITRQDEQLAKIMEHVGMQPENSFAVAIYHPAGL